MPRPLNVILDLTSRCNLKCVMCYFAATDRLAFPPFDRQLSDDGNMPIEVFERIAADLFPKAWRVALACAAEPMIHPRFREIVEIAGRYGVPDLWFPTNLLALTEPTAQALVRHGVADGRSLHRRRDEGDLRKDPRAGEVRAPARVPRHARARPARSPVEDAAPADHLHVDEVQPPGARPAARVRRRPWRVGDRRAVRLADRGRRRHARSCSPGEDPAELNAELGAAARDAVRRGLKLSSYPEFEPPGSTARGLLVRARRRLWRWKAGMDRPEYLRYGWYQGLFGCAYPDRNYVIRPNGAVSPCIYWDQDPIGFYPADRSRRIAAGAPLEAHPRRTAHGPARRDLRHLRRTAHGALPAGRNARRRRRLQPDACRRTRALSGARPAKRKAQERVLG